jgi:hypothetical protein
MESKEGSEFDSEAAAKRTEGTSGLFESQAEREFKLRDCGMQQAIHVENSGKP